MPEGRESAPTGPVCPSLGEISGHEEEVRGQKGLIRGKRLLTPSR